LAKVLAKHFDISQQPAARLTAALSGTARSPGPGAGQVIKQKMHPPVGGRISQVLPVNGVLGLAVKACGDGGEDRLETGFDKWHDANQRQASGCGDQAIFDCRCTGIVIEKLEH
jgi:hypothetical protein